MLFKCNFIWEWSACVSFTDLFLNNFFLKSEQAVVVVLGFLFVSLFFSCIFPFSGSIARDTTVEKHTNIGTMFQIVFRGNGYAVCNLVSKNNFRKNLVKLQ